MRRVVPLAWSASAAAAAVVTACLLPINGTVGSVAAEAPKAQLLSAAGNVVGRADVMQTAAVVYLSSYPDYATCQRKAKELVASNPKRYRSGGCSKVTSGPYKGYWQVWVDDTSFCYDRVAPTNDTVLATATSRRLAA